MVANTDQWVDFDIDEYVLAAEGYDGLIMTMRATDPKWSFVRTDPAGKVVEVLEKVPISDQATVGIYNFGSGAAFAAAASAMIEADEQVNGEFYVAPVYNRLIASGADVGTYDVGGEGRGMYGLGIPADLKLFLRDPASERALSQVVALRRRVSSS
jgi:dTDP-glucose pyrophosphorylase